MINYECGAGKDLERVVWIVADLDDTCVRKEEWKIGSSGLVRESGDRGGGVRGGVCYWRKI